MIVLPVSRSPLSIASMPSRRRALPNFRSSLTWRSTKSLKLFVFAILFSVQRRPRYVLQHGEITADSRCKFERQPWRECGVTVRITPTVVVGGFVYRQGCRNPYSKIRMAVKGRFSGAEQLIASPLAPK